MTIQWWALQDAGDRQPYAVMSLDDADGLPRRFVPGEGLVPWPTLSAYAVNGEPGARPIDEAEAVRLMDEGVGAIDPGYVALGRGDGETTQPPTGAPVTPSTPAAPDEEPDAPPASDAPATPTGDQPTT